MLWLRRFGQRRPLRTLAGLVSLCGLVSCDSTGPRAASKLAFTVQPSAVTAGTSTPALQVTVQDAAGRTVTSAATDITIAITAGTGGPGAVLGGILTHAAAGGVATFADLTIDKASAAYTLTATAAGLSAATSASFTVSAGLATQIAIYAGGAQSGTVGTAVTTLPSAIVMDANGNGVSGTSVTFAVTAGGSSITGPTQTSNASGIATVGSWTLGTNASNNVVTATAIGLTGSPVGFAATGNAGPATQMWIKGGNGQGATVGSALATPPTLIVYDAYFNKVSGTSVTFAVASGGGFGTGLTQITSAIGLAGVGSWTLGATAGANTMTATAAGLTGSPLTFWATATPLGPGVFVNLTAGRLHSCGLTSNGVAYCWGANGDGELGDGTTTAQRTTPVAVQGGLAFVSIIAGDFHTCGLTNNGAAYCWGRSQEAQLGGSSIFMEPPMPVVGGLSFVSLVAGSLRSAHTCGLTGAGAAYCWGFGVLGDGTSTRGGPVAVSGGLVFASLAVGADHTCGVTTGGAAYCWGGNYRRQLGDGTPEPYRLTPVPVVGGLVFASVTAGQNHTCGLTSAGAAYCWGDNFVGQGGNDAIGDLNTPAAVSGGLVFARLVAGGTHTCGLTRSGAVYCWGDDFNGQLGNGTSENWSATPGPVSGGLVFTRLIAGASHSCGITNNGVARCWGWNVTGQLGDGSTIDRTTPTVVLNP